MVQTAFVPGYVSYLLMIFLPGIGFGELLGVWREDDRIADRLAYAFGLGLAVDTFVFVVRTSGVKLLGFTLAGLDLFTVYFPILAGSVALIASFALRRRFVWPVKPKALDLVLLLVILIQGLMVLLYFQKYPIFPEYQSADYANHVQFAQGLISGSYTSVPRGILYFGVHYQLASALLLVGGEALVTAQRTLAIMVVLSPLLFYLAIGRIFGSKEAGFVIAVIYSLSGTIWFDSVFNSGLYANFFGMLASLFLVVGFADLTGKVRSGRLWLVYLVALVTAYFSHYTVVTLFPALLAVPVIHYVRSRSGLLGYLAPPVVSVAPGVVGLAVYPGVLSLVIALAEAGGGSISGGSTFLSSAFSGWPVLHYMSLEVYSDIAFVFLFIFTAIYVYRGVISKVSLFSIPVVWFLSLLIASPFNVNAWRFSFEALVPLTLMAGFGVFTLIPKVNPNRGKRRSADYGQYGKSLVVIAILLIPLVAFSWGQQSLSDSLSNTSVSSQAQQDVYNALYWLKNNTSTSSRYLSVSDWRFTYTSLFFGRTTDYSFASVPADALKFAKQNGDQFIIVTNVVTVQLPPVPSLFPWNNFQNSANLSMVYSNSDVRIFGVT